MNDIDRFCSLIFPNDNYFHLFTIEIFPYFCMIQNRISHFNLYIFSTYFKHNTNICLYEYVLYEHDISKIDIREYKKYILRLSG